MSKNEYIGYKLRNVHASQCYSCKAISLWLYNKLLFPVQSLEIEPNEDLSEDIKVDFDEARKIFSISAKGSAALLRLCIQKLCIQLGKPGKDLNADIGALVADGLPILIQKALDVVRVVGNEAVHPGQIDLRDNPEIAYKLFELVNLIAHNRLTEPKQIEEIFRQAIPESKRKAIESRDSKNKED